MEYERLKVPVHKQWEVMESLVVKGLVKGIGVSNFNVQLLNDLLSYANIPPATNEVELHPLCVQKNLVSFCLKEGVLPIGYCPLARGEDKRIANPLETEPVKKAAEKYGKTPGQVVLNWGLTRGYAVIPKSEKKHRQIENLGAAGWSLSAEEVEEIAALN